jgi:hypothetical protein
LQASGASPFTFCASAISTCQPASSSRSCTKRTVHRLDRRADRFAVTIEPLAQATQTVGIWWRRTDLDRRTLTVEQETLATEIQTGGQHRSGPPLR